MSEEKIFEEEKAVYTADHCLSCTSCMSSCPVMEASKEYRGPKLVGPAHGRMHFSQDDYEDSLDFCSNCKSCDRACPSGVAVSTLNMLQRAEYYRHNPHPQHDDMLAHGERMAKLVRMMPFGAAFANDCYLISSRSGTQREEIKGSYDEHFAKGCSKSLACEDVCPMKIPTLTSIARMNRNR